MICSFLLLHYSVVGYTTGVIYPFYVNGHLDRFEFWANINTAAVSILVQVFGGCIYAFLLGTVVELLGQRAYVH